MKISVVSPIYKGADMLHALVERCEKAIFTITDDYELILVNDHSPDNSWEIITQICASDPKVVGVDLSRNWGQHPAISAGLSVSTGEWVVVMDCDLQDRPEEIPALYQKALEGYDIVYARRVERQDGYWKRLSSTIFHTVYDWLAGYKTDKTIANFGIYNRIVIDEVCRIPDLSRGFGSLLHHLGFNSTAIDVTHAERMSGSSGYTLAKLLKLAFENCIANSNKPLRITVEIGLVMSTVSFLLALYNLIAKLCGIISVEGFTTTVFSIWFVGGLLLFVCGIIGLYIGKIYDQVKGRPYVVIRKVINSSKTE